LWNSLPAQIRKAEVALGHRMSGLGSFAEPAHGFRQVAANSLALRIHDSQVQLRVRLPLIGRFAHPAPGLAVALRNPLAEQICEAHLKLGVRVTLRCRFTVPVQSFVGVFRNAVAQRIHRAENRLRCRVATLRKRPDDAQGCGVVLPVDRRLYILKSLLLRAGRSGQREGQKENANHPLHVHARPTEFITSIVLWRRFWPGLRQCGFAAVIDWYWHAQGGSAWLDDRSCGRNGVWPAAGRNVFRKSPGESIAPLGKSAASSKPDPVRGSDSVFRWGAGAPIRPPARPAARLWLRGFPVLPVLLRRPAVLPGSL